MAYGGDYNVGGCRVDGDVKKVLNEGQRMSEENDCLLLNVKVNGVFAGYIFSRVAKKLHQRIWDAGTPRTITPEKAARLAVAFADALIQELNYRKDLDNENQ